MDRPPAIIIATDVAARLEAVLEHAQGDAAAVAARLEDELARAELRAPADMPADVVTMHSVVSFVDEQSGATHDARLVYPRESAGRPTPADTPGVRHASRRSARRRTTRPNAS